AWQPASALERVQARWRAIFTASAATSSTPRIVRRQDRSPRNLSWRNPNRRVPPRRRSRRRPPAARLGNNSPRIDGRPAAKKQDHAGGGHRLYTHRALMDFPPPRSIAVPRTGPSSVWQIEGPRRLLSHSRRKAWV